MSPKPFDANYRFVSLLLAREFSITIIGNYTRQRDASKNEGAILTQLIVNGTAALTMTYNLGRASGYWQNLLTENVTKHTDPKYISVKINFQFVLKFVKRVSKTDQT